MEAIRSIADISDKVVNKRWSLWKWRPVVNPPRAGADLVSITTPSGVLFSQDLGFLHINQPVENAYFGRLASVVGSVGCSVLTARPHCSQCRPDRCNSQRTSVCLSVRLSVTFRCFVHMNEDTIVWSSASSRIIHLVSGEVKFIRYSQGITPSEGVKVRLYSTLSLAKIWPINRP